MSSEEIKKVWSCKKFLNYTYPKHFIFLVFTISTFRFQLPHQCLIYCSASSLSPSKSSPSSSMSSAFVCSEVVYWRTLHCELWVRVMRFYFGALQSAIASAVAVPLIFKPCQHGIMRVYNGPCSHKVESRLSYEK